jgi:hypothetical protein
MAAIIAFAAAMTSSTGSALDAAAAHWVVDPTNAGNDLPARGRSLFDYLVTDEGTAGPGQVVPFPFAALLQRIESRIASEPRANLPTAVLIPLGRSLQRTAAAPEFFAFPRAVVAVVAEPAGSRDPYLKDRLYLGYQEKANVIEVISYNEEEGRFEFQVVTDYRPGGTPRIAYANRTLCMACHQNAAPIFSRAVWDETNANPAVAKLLAAERRHFYDIPVDRGVDVPNAIDDAKLRANRFAVHQLLWKEGCGGNSGAAVNCRAGLFEAMLRYRLSGRPMLDRASYGGRVVAPLLATAHRRWPGGLAIGNPDIPNRNPVPASMSLPSALGLRESRALANIAAAFDPLLPRPPLEVWRVDDDDDVDRLVTGLSDFLAASDIEALDKALLERAKTRRAARRTYRASCNVEPAGAERGRQRVEFHCTPVSTPDRAFVVEGRLFVGNNQIVGGAIDRLEIDGLPPSRDLDLDVRRSDLRRGAGVTAATPMRGRLRARAPDGNALDRIEFRWDSRGGGAATLVVVDDFASARNAIDELANADLTGKFDGFDAVAFRRARLVPALLQRLGAKPEAWCCIDAAGMRPAHAARADTPEPPVGAGFKSATAASHAAFHRYCRECHLSNERAPPNYLFGDADEVEAKLKHCAPRIYYRLAMWQRAGESRAKTPMPPEIAVRRFNLADAAWRDGGTLSSLLLSIDDRLQAEGGGQGGDAVLRQSYESLRACLPDDSATLPAPGAKQTPHTATLDR